ncbi:MAG: recombinase family protein [Methanomicrobiaceae archaeon]|uniref:Resolvase/invertase-type recombinase catalytic domain-containing protein n=1 Tax=hydrocarbon metagenome TaxID=938273 RepID=A0A0W8FKT7_9ZZZZ|nr:recombinase family protein [Methanomicrobiaceae archaeon]MDD5418247.1 recombinase family protein [Methanomicrobiaceae archaeon]
MKKDAVVYLNTKKKGDFELQKSEIENYCKYRFNITRIYHDHRMNATPPEKRASFQEMTEFCDNNDIKNIILYNFSDLARDVDQSLDALKNLTDADYTVYSAKQDIFGSFNDPDQRKEAMCNFFSFMDQYRESMRRSAPANSRKTASEGTRAIGRPKALNEGQIEALLAVRKAGTSISQICRMFGVSRSTVSKILAAYPELKGQWKGGAPEPENE